QNSRLRQLPAAPKFPMYLPLQLYAPVPPASAPALPSPHLHRLAQVLALPVPALHPPSAYPHPQKAHNHHPPPPPTALHLQATAHTHTANLHCWPTAPPDCPTCRIAVLLKTSVFPERSTKVANTGIGQSTTRNL